MNIIPAEILLPKLEDAGLQPYLYYQAKSGSYYVKFKHTGLKTLRVSDHVGKEQYKYFWNLRSDYSEYLCDRAQGVRHFYPENQVELMIADMVQYKKRIGRDLNYIPIRENIPNPPNKANPFNIEYAREVEKKYKIDQLKRERAEKLTRESDSVTRQLRKEKKQKEVITTRLLRFD